MTEHCTSQEPDGQDQHELMEMAERLFSPATPAGELERICMQLAHVASDQAQELLTRFRRSPRASAVEWLDCALEEGAFNLLSPRNELEEHEFLVLKVIEDVEEVIDDLCMRREDLELCRRKLRVRRDALHALVAAGRVGGNLAADADDELARVDAEMAELADRIQVEEAVIDELRSSIKTDRYRNADPRLIRSIHLL
jgi:hypothetical protein